MEMECVVNVRALSSPEEESTLSGVCTYLESVCRLYILISVFPSPFVVLRMRSVSKRVETCWSVVCSNFSGGADFFNKERSMLSCANGQWTKRHSPSPTHARLPIKLTLCFGFVIAPIAQGFTTERVAFSGCTQGS